jgi:hypothetical protein
MRNSSVEDLQMLRLIKAFQKIKSEEARRAIILLVEEQAEKEAVKSPKDIATP